MSCCDYCNFRNTEKCNIEQIWAKFDEGEITEDEANDLSQTAYMKCEDKHHDWELDQGDIRNDR